MYASHVSSNKFSALSPLPQCHLKKLATNIEQKTKRLTKRVSNTVLNPAMILAKSFSQTPNPDCFYRPIPIPVINFLNPLHQRKKAFSGGPDPLTAKPLELKISSFHKSKDIARSCSIFQFQINKVTHPLFNTLYVIILCL